MCQLKEQRDIPLYVVPKFVIEILNSLMLLVIFLLYLDRRFMPPIPEI